MKTLVIFLCCFVVYGLMVDTACAETLRELLREEDAQNLLFWAQVGEAVRGAVKALIMFVSILGTILCVDLINKHMP